MKKYFLLVVFSAMLLTAPGVLLAQEAGIPIDLEAVKNIVEVGIGGFTVFALTEILKRIFKMVGLDGRTLGWICSGIASVVLVAIYFLQIGWSTGGFVVYSILVFGFANGLFKGVKAAARGS